VTLPEFEGPLDLLLHLCQTHELDILNISIAFIAEKYIEYLEVMQNMSVEVAADYLVMAAHLAYLKSRELVPSPEPLEVSEDGEDPIDPREELIRRLLQYQKYKNAAESLSNRPIEGRNVFVRGAVLEPSSEAGLAEHSVWKLLEHWAQILEKAKPQYTHDVVVDRMSIADRINQIVDLLESRQGHGPLRRVARRGSARGGVAPQGRGVPAGRAGAGEIARGPHPAASGNGQLLPGPDRRCQPGRRAQPERHLGEGEANPRSPTRPTPRPWSSKARPKRAPRRAASGIARHRSEIRPPTEPAADTASKEPATSDEPVVDAATSEEPASPTSPSPLRRETLSRRGCRTAAMLTDETLTDEEAHRRRAALSTKSFPPAKSPTDDTLTLNALPCRGARRRWKSPPTAEWKLRR
jgi:chromatin segregation and condensation protein Rec8/ScpA/Scc1 (kleisin family)